MIIVLLRLNFPLASLSPIQSNRHACIVTHGRHQSVVKCYAIPCNFYRMRFRMQPAIGVFPVLHSSTFCRRDRYALGKGVRRESASERVGALAWTPPLRHGPTRVCTDTHLQLAAWRSSTLKSLSQYRGRSAGWESDLAGPRGYGECNVN